MKKAFFSLTSRLGFCLLAIMLSASGGWAKPTTPEQARKVVQNWLRPGASFMSARISRQIREVRTFNDETGTPAYYVVHLNPSGLVFLPADDLVEPIISFVCEATSFDPSPKNPLGALVSGDIPGRVIEARKTEARARAIKAPLAPDSPWAQSRQKWEQLANSSTSLNAPAYWVGPADIRVPPLVQSNWDQAGADGSDAGASCNKPCYNYYTPNQGNPDATFEGNPYNSVCGCPATAMSQLLRYWQYPASPVPGTFPVTLIANPDTSPTKFLMNRAIRGGSLPGGGYDWANMELNPENNGVDTTQCQAIGALTHDAGVSVNTQYSLNNSSVPDIALLVPALINVFRYSNAICGSTNGPYIDLFDQLVWDSIERDTLYKMVNPNLDAQYPVLFAIVGQYNGRPIGHAIVGDGYGLDGYGANAKTMYHHLNMGWHGLDDTWYNLPDIRAASQGVSFSSVPQCIYNVYKTGAGEIISGRVTDATGNPLSGVTVTATAGGQTYPAVQKDVEAPTTRRGVYAIPKVPSNTTFNVTASKPGYTFTPKSVWTGTSKNSTITYIPSTGDDYLQKYPTKDTGNQWGIDFVATKVKGGVGSMMLLLID